jgi:putative nucleotidyltransferase with HDIG domain
MPKIPLTRSEAIELLKKYNSPENIADWNHFLESEAIMRGVARFLGENEEEWGMLGLLHDVDWGLTKNNISDHLTKAPDILREAGFDDEFINNIVSHGYGFNCAGLEDKKREGKIQHALAASETLTGIVYAYALMRGKKISDMEVKGLKKKFKDKKFAEACNRNIVREIEEVGLSLDEFFEIAIEAMKKIKEDIGLE